MDDRASSKVSFGGLASPQSFREAIQQHLNHFDYFLGHFLGNFLTLFEPGSLSFDKKVLKPFNSVLFLLLGVQPCLKKESFFRQGGTPNNKKYL